jgi:hypothetical protein
MNSAINQHGAESRCPLNWAGVLRIPRLHKSDWIVQKYIERTRWVETTWKAPLLEQEMDDYGVGILGLSETHWNTN